MAYTAKLSSALLSALVLGNCAGFDTPDNLEPVATGDAYQAQYRSPDKRRAQADFLRSADMNAAKCKPLRGGAGGKGAGASALGGAGVAQ